MAGAEVPFIDVGGNVSSATTDGTGNFSIEEPAGDFRVNTINFNGTTFNIQEIVFNVTIGNGPVNIGQLVVDREKR